MTEQNKSDIAKQNPSECKQLLREDCEKLADEAEPSAARELAEAFHTEWQSLFPGPGRPKVSTFGDRDRGGPIGKLRRDLESIIGTQQVALLDRICRKVLGVLNAVGERELLSAAKEMRSAAADYVGRPISSADSILDEDDLQPWHEPGRFYFDGRPYDITSRLLDVLEFFVNGRPGYRFTYAEIEKAIAGKDCDLEDDSLRTYISDVRMVLRRALRDSGIECDDPIPSIKGAGAWELVIDRQHFTKNKKQ